MNLGKNKLSGHPVVDYVTGVKVFGKVADYLVINVSSPNTPGLRNMQGRQELETLMDPVGAPVKSFAPHLPVNGFGNGHLFIRAFKDGSSCNDLSEFGTEG